MEIDKAYLIGTHRYSFRAAEPAEIIGVGFYPSNSKSLRITDYGLVFDPDHNRPPAVCYHVRYLDGTEDYVAISDSENYEIISASNVQLSRKSNQPCSN